MSSGAQDLKRIASWQRTDSPTDLGDQSSVSKAHSTSWDCESWLYWPESWVFVLSARQRSLTFSSLPVFRLHSLHARRFEFSFYFYDLEAATVEIASAGQLDHHGSEPFWGLRSLFWSSSFDLMGYLECLRWFLEGPLLRTSCEFS